MRGVSGSFKVIHSFLKVRCEFLTHISLSNNLNSCRSCHSQVHHKRTRLGQSLHRSLISKVVSNDCNILLASRYSASFPVCPSNYVVQCSRTLFSSAVAGFSRSLGILDIQRFYTSEHRTPRIPILSQVMMNETYYAKRYVGRSNRYQDDDVSSSSINVASAKYKLHDRTRSALKGRVSRLQISILHHKARLRDQIKAQRVKGALTVGALRKKFGVKKENVKTIPNLLTTLRMASAPMIAYLVVNESFSLACTIFVIAGITDLLDGYIARNFKNQTTALGTALDPLADKLLISFLTVSLTSAGLIPVPVTLLILGRDAGLIIASFYIRYISLAPPRTLSRYFDVSHVTAKLYPSKISKLNTLLQLSFVASTLASPVFDFVGHPLLQALMYLTATTTFLSGADYMLTWRQRLQIIKNK